MNNIKKYRELGRSIHSWACEKQHWLGEKENERVKRALIITELSEAIEADRNDRRLSESVLLRNDHYLRDYEYYLKGTLHEELADAAIRTLDLWYYSVLNPRKVEAHSECWDCIDLFYQAIFPEQIYQLMRIIIHYPADRLLDAVDLIEIVARDQGINLIQEIERKMLYNYRKVDSKKSY